LPIAEFILISGRRQWDVPLAWRGHLSWSLSLCGDYVIFAERPDFQVVERLFQRRMIDL
jgi:hypothetical protein